MSVLTGPEICRVVKRSKGIAVPWNETSDTLPRILIDPFDPAMCGPNSYDVTLGDTLLRYNRPFRHGVPLPIDPLNPPPTMTVPAENDGWLLDPGVLYLGSTAERIACHGVVPWIDGRSSVGRLGISVHVTAGRGDDGWPGPGREPAPFTLEITVVHPTILRPGMRLAQLAFMRVEGDRRPYAGRYGEATAAPVASRFHQEGR